MEIVIQGQNRPSPRHPILMQPQRLSRACQSRIRLLLQRLLLEPVTRSDRKGHATWPHVTGRRSRRGRRIPDRPRDTDSCGLRRSPGADSPLDRSDNFRIPRRRQRWTRRAAVRKTDAGPMRSEKVWQERRASPPTPNPSMTNAPACEDPAHPAGRLPIC